MSEIVKLKNSIKIIIPKIKDINVATELLAQLFFKGFNGYSNYKPESLIDGFTLIDSPIDIFLLIGTDQDVESECKIYYHKGLDATVGFYDDYYFIRMDDWYFMNYPSYNRKGDFKIVEESFNEFIKSENK